MHAIYSKMAIWIPNRSITISVLSLSYKASLKGMFCICLQFSTKKMKGVLEEFTIEIDNLDKCLALLNCD